MPTPHSLHAELPGPFPPDQEALYRAAWPSADLLAETVPLVSASRALLLGCAADPFTVLAVRRATTGDVLVADDDAAACDALLDQVGTGADLGNLRCTDPMHLAADPDVADRDLAVGNTLYHANKRMTAALIRLAHARLVPGGTLYLVGANQRGIRSIGDEARAVFGNVATVALRKGQRVLAATRGTEPVAAPDPAFADQDAGDSSNSAETVTLRGQALHLLPGPLVFAGGRLDPATALLAQVLEVRADDTFADLGCGNGVLGLLAARLAPSAHVVLVDTSRAAVRLARANLDLNGIVGATVVAGDAITCLRGRTPRPTVIATNPPFHVGQLHTDAIARRFIAGAAELLAPGGRFYLVANRFLPYEAELRTHFREVREAAGDPRYKVLVAGDPLDRNGA